jgi:heptosyltransferase-2
MITPPKILVFHTAFVGDIILVLPLVQRIKEIWPASRIAVAAIPSVAPVLQNHPAIAEIIKYDKRRTDGGMWGMMKLARKLRHQEFDLAFVPHRSIRSAAIVSLAGIPRRIGFSTSTGRFLLTDAVRYRKDLHEIDRNLSLLGALGKDWHQALPSLYPDNDDVAIVDNELLRCVGDLHPPRLIGFAPGSVWNTKRWPPEKFTALGRMISDEGFRIVMIGGPDDSTLCEEIARRIGDRGILNSAGRLTLLQSAEMIRRCQVLVSNDSAPVHMAVAMRTPVVAIFGPTVPQFGFAPRGSFDAVVETDGLHCRPCGMHGGEQCPVGTFDCMLRIDPERVRTAVVNLVSKKSGAISTL